MKPVFTVDGRAYRVMVPAEGLKRSGKVTDSEKSGRVQSGRMSRDIIGTYYNYALQLETEQLDVAEYDALYETLTDPALDSHIITMPYGQGVITLEAYVSTADDVLKYMSPTQNLWGGLTINFIAMEPQRRRG